MDIKVNLDESCKNCKIGLKYFKELHKRHKNHYAFLNMKSYMPIASILITPDYNCSGHLTHFHISKADKKFLEKYLARTIVMEKEAKLMSKFRLKNGK